MRISELALAGVLVLAGPPAAHAFAPGSAGMLPPPHLVQVADGCNPGWRFVPGHWNEWRREWIPPHCVPHQTYGGSGRGGGSRGAYDIYGGPGGGWNPYANSRGPFRTWRDP
jgi:hypothetical protein